MYDLKVEYSAWTRKKSESKKVIMREMKVSLNMSWIQVQNEDIKSMEIEHCHLLRSYLITK